MQQFIQTTLRNVRTQVLDDTTYLTILFLLVAVASFMFGRLSATEPQALTRPVLVPTPVAVAADIPAEAVAGVTTGAYVASKAGTKYHALMCPGAKQISEKNKVYFSSITEAEAAGYVRAANCPEL